jgi:hypothetical protein
MPEPPRPTYTAEEAAEILKRALKQQSVKEQGLSHDELVEMAAEVGIPREALEDATAHVGEERAAELERQSQARELAEERTRLFNRFVSSLLVYIVVNSILYFVDRRFTGGTWFYFVLLGWGIGLLFQLRSVLFPQGSLLRRRRREARLAAKSERRALRDARRQRMLKAFTSPVHAQHELETGAREFESAVQAGVAALLQVAARKIHDHAERSSIESAPRRRR